MGDQENLPPPIKQYLDNYDTAKAHYRDLAKFVAKECEKALRSEAIPCIVTSRPKDPDSLKDKLLKRHRKDPSKYKDVDSINDITDLAGVRIALYFPKQRPRVAEEIKKKFIVDDDKPHSGDPNEDENDNLIGFQRRFPGYSANHYWVLLKPEDAKKLEHKQRYLTEIQVISVLRHAWAEIEHDTVYKELTRPASLEERRILDGLAGAIHMGECFLDQFCDTQQMREDSADKPFESIYELGFFVTRWIAEKANRSEESLGPIGALKKLLEFLEMNTPKALTLELQKLDFKMGADSPYRKMEEEYAPIKLKASIYIIDHILLARDHSPVTIRAMANTRGRQDESIYKLKVMASAMIWLDELFPPFSVWERKLAGHEDQETKRAGLRWLGSTKLLGPLQHQAPLEGRDKVMVETLWHWFEMHPERAIQFVFKISKLGLCRDFKEECYLLGRAFLLLNEVLASA